MTRRQPPRCGTNSGYVKHLNLKEAPCDACRKAHADYHRGHLERNPEYAETQRARMRSFSKARSRAYKRLAAENPEQYAAFLAEEREKVAAEEQAKAGGE